jgi:hypothetical protein
MKAQGLATPQESNPRQWVVYRQQELVKQGQRRCLARLQVPVKEPPTAGGRARDQDATGRRCCMA